MKQMEKEVISECSENDPLGFKEETVEDIFGQFFTHVEATKVKNLSNIPMSDSIKAFLSLGAKFCPNEFDIDRELEIDLMNGWFRKGFLII